MMGALNREAVEHVAGIAKWSAAAGEASFLPPADGVDLGFGHASARGAIRLSGGFLNYGLWQRSGVDPPERTDPVCVLKVE